MANPNLGHIILEAWDHVCRTTPDPFRQTRFYWMENDPRSYRDRLDEREVNMYGEVIPRIERVKRHLLLYKNPRLDPRRLP